jgi:hypothetical protein
MTKKFGELEVNDKFHGIHSFTRSDLQPKAILTWASAAQQYKECDIQFDIFKQKHLFEDNIILMDFEIHGDRRLAGISTKCLYNNNDDNICNCIMWTGNLSDDSGHWKFIQIKPVIT